MKPIARFVALLLALSAGLSACACGTGSASWVRREGTASELTQTSPDPSLETLGWTVGSPAAETLFN